MSVLEIDRPVADLDCMSDTSVPAPLFRRLNVAEGQLVVVQLVGSDEDFKNIGAFPNLDGAIEWRRHRVDQPIDPRALFTLVIWNPSYSQHFPLSLRADRQASSILFAYRSPEIPPYRLNGQLTSRLHFEGPVRALMRRLVTSLIIPVTFDGLICVADADIQQAVNRGGTVMQFVRRSDDVQRAFAAILRDITTHLHTLRPEASVCVGILADAASLNMGLVDQIGGEINRMLHPEILLVISAVAQSGKGACISVLTTAGHALD
jgi:hypothetical protein